MPVPRAVPLRTSTRVAACNHSVHVKPCDAGVRRASSRRGDRLFFDAAGHLIHHFYVYVGRVDV